MYTFLIFFNIFFFKNILTNVTSHKKIFLRSLFPKSKRGVMRKLLVSSLLVLLLPLALKATVLKELDYVASSPDYMVYFDIDTFIKYFNQNGISNSDIKLLYDANGLNELEEFLKDYGFSIFDVLDIAFFGNINPMSTQQIFTFSLIFKLKNSKIILPSKILENYEDSQYGKIYFIDGQKNICIALFDNLIIAGDKKFITDYMKSKASQKTISSPEIKSLQKQMKGKILLGMLGFNDFMKTAIKALLSEVSSKMSGLEKNVFLQSMIAMDKFEILLSQEKKSLKSEFIITSPTEEDAQRMLMVAHTVIVASSFFIYALENLLPEFSEFLSAAGDENYLVENFQKQIASIKTNRNKKIVTILSENTETETIEEFKRLKERLIRIKKNKEENNTEQNSF
jgi:hypothetical protein